MSVVVICEVLVSGLTYFREKVGPLFWHIDVQAYFSLKLESQNESNENFARVFFLFLEVRRSITE